MMLLLLPLSCIQTEAKFVLSDGLPLISEKGAAVPVVQLNLNQTIDLFSYIHAIDEQGKDVSDRIQLVSGFFDPKKAGEYTLTYRIENKESVETLVLKVVVRPFPEDPQSFIPKIIMLNAEGEAVPELISPDLFFEVGECFVDPGFTVEDRYDLEIPQGQRTVSYFEGGRVDESRQITEIDTSQRGYYTILYTAVNSLGNSAKAVRHVQVAVRNEVAPTVHLNDYGEGQEGINPVLELGIQHYTEKGIFVEKMVYKYLTEGNELVDGAIENLTVDADYIASHRLPSDPTKIEIVDMAVGNRAVAYLEIESLPSTLLSIEYEIQYLMQPAARTQIVALWHSVRRISFKDTTPPVLSFQSPGFERVTAKPGSYLPRPAFSIFEEGDPLLEETQVEARYYRLTYDEGGTETATPVSSLPQADDVAGTRYRIEYSVQDYTGNHSTVVGLEGESGHPLVQEILVMDGSAPYLEYEEGFNDLFFYDTELTEANVYHYLSDPDISAVRIFDVGDIDENGRLKPPVELTYSETPLTDAGYFKINLGQLRLNQPGVYTVYYYTVDNAKNLRFEGEPACNQWNENGTMVNNAKEYPRRVHIIGTPQWAGGDYFPMQTDGTAVLKWKEMPLSTHITQFEIIEYADRTDTPVGDPLLVAGASRQQTVPVNGSHEGNTFKIRAHYERPAGAAELAAHWSRFNSDASNSDSRRGFSVVPQSRSVQASRGTVDAIAVSWDRVENADGYLLYACTPALLQSKKGEARSECRVAKCPASADALFSYSYRKNSPCFHVEAAGITEIQTDGRFGCPPGKVYFWMEPYVDPTLHHGSGDLHRLGVIDWNATDPYGMRAFDAEEACSLSLEMTYLACKEPETDFHNTPYNKYWAAKSSDNALINEGSSFEVDPRGFDFSTNPWQVPEHLDGECAQGGWNDKTGSMRSHGKYTNKLGHKSFPAGGETVSELVMVRGTLVVSDERYALARWWMHDIPFKLHDGEFILEKGWRVYEHDWGHTQEQRLKVIVWDKVANRRWVFFFDWDQGKNSAKYDTDHRPVGGPCFKEDKYMDLSFDNEAHWSTFTYNKSNHFSW